MNGRGILIAFMQTGIHPDPVRGAHAGAPLRYHWPPFPV